MTGSTEAISVTTLYRPTGANELTLIRASGFRAYPPRLPEQAIFYPVRNFDHAAQIARDWNSTKPPDFVGYVTRVSVWTAWLARFDVQTVGARMHQEYWIPAGELDDFNAQIAGQIEVMATFRRGDDAEE